MYKLVIQDDEGKTTVVPLIRDELTIGRKEGNTIRLTERNVSRRHARLLRQNGSISIEDLNSYNGIRVNGTRISGRASIKESDRVQIGDYLIEIKSETHDKVETLNGRTQVTRLDAAAPEAVASTDSSAQPTNRISTSTLVDTPSYPMTEPMLALAEADAPPPVAAKATVGVGTANGRLVALSSLFAGREFDLDKPAMVIGRTDDNDVCLDHRSISRHHAKVVRENGRYAIVDLQSSNGVRVNGEEYGKVELRRGDVVDLGHVRLRFVEPGEDFLFGRDAQAVEMDAGGGPRVMLWVALALLVLGGAVAVFMTMGGDDEQGRRASGQQPSADRGSATSGNLGRPPAVEPLITPKTLDAGAAVPPDLADQFGKHFGMASQAVAGEAWQVALDEASAALAIDPDHVEAKALETQARIELGQEKLHGEFRRAVGAKQYGKIAAIYAKLDPDSVYKVKAQPDHDRLKADYLRIQGEAGGKLADRGKCREQRKLAVEAERVWGPDARLAVLATTCKEPVVTSGGQGSGDSGSGTGNGTPPDGGDDPPDAGPTADQLLAEAREAAKHDQFGKALRLCQAALVKRAGDSEAAQMCVMAACNLGSAATAKKYLDKVKSESRVQALKQICLGKGVDVR